MPLGFWVARPAPVRPQVKHFHLWRFVLTMEQEHDYTGECERVQL